MKSLNNLEDINYINTILNRMDMGQSVIQGKIEVYTVKSLDEHLTKEITEKYCSSAQEQSPWQQQQQSPSVHSWQQSSSPYGSPDAGLDAPSPFGPLTHAKSRTTFCTLLETLNRSYPDYDFASVSPGAFTAQPNLHLVMSHVNMCLRDVFSDTDRALLWSLFSNLMDVNRVSIYSYNPSDTNPLGCSEGKLWNFNYFFLTASKRVVLFTCHALSKDAMCDEDDYAMSDDETEFDTSKNMQYYYPWQAPDEAPDVMFDPDW